MTVTIDPAFRRDLKKRKGDAALLKGVRAAVLAAEAAAKVGDLPGFKFLSDGRGYGRIRVGRHRLGVKVDGNVVRFFRCLPRDRIYQFFP